MLRYLLAFVHERSEIPRPVTLDIYSLKKEQVRLGPLGLGIQNSSLGRQDLGVHKLLVPFDKISQHRFYSTTTGIGGLKVGSITR